VNTKWLHFPNYLCLNHKRSGDELTAIWLAKIKYRRGELLLHGSSPFSFFTLSRNKILSIKKSCKFKHFSHKIKKDTQQFQRIADGVSSDDN